MGIEQEELHELVHSLMDEYAEKLIKLSYTYVKDMALAEDMVQETFIRFYDRFYQFKGLSSYQTYLYRICINLCHDELKKWSSRNILYTNKIVSFFKNTNSSTEDRVIENEDKNWIAKEIMNLPIRFREVIILYYYKDFSYKEIAEILNCKEGTVKTRLHRGRKALEDKIDITIGEGEVL